MPTTDYNARVDLAHRLSSRPDDPWTDDVLDALAGYSAVVSRDPRGHTTIDLTLPAESVRQAVTAALALVATAARGAQVTGIEVITTEAFDEREAQTAVPALVSVTEAANILGTTRQAVLQRLTTGGLRGEKVGSTWVLAEQDVTAEAAASAQRLQAEVAP